MICFHPYPAPCYMWDTVNMQTQKVSKVPPLDGTDLLCEKSTSHMWTSQRASDAKRCVIFLSMNKLLNKQYSCCWLQWLVTPLSSCDSTLTKKISHARQLLKSYRIRCSPIGSYDDPQQPAQVTSNHLTSCPQASIHKPHLWPHPSIMIATGATLSV